MFIILRHLFIYQWIPNIVFLIIIYLFVEFVYLKLSKQSVDLYFLNFIYSVILIYYLLIQLFIDTINNWFSLMRLLGHLVISFLINWLFLQLLIEEKEANYINFDNNAFFKEHYQELYKNSKLIIFIILAFIYIFTIFINLIFSSFDWYKKLWRENKYECK
jgi:hypothetical protein